MVESQEPRVGVGCFVTRKGAEGSPDSFLIGRRQGSHGAGACQLPGGHLEFNETFEECAIREVYEETGLTLKSVEFATATNDIMKGKPLQSSISVKPEVNRILCRKSITIEENRHYCTIFMKGVVEPDDVQNLRTMEPHKLDGDWAWITWEELLNGGDQIRPLFIPLQNVLATRPSFRI
ncbi:hypothetical protein INT43_005235 [Umbelopsis isabellina]|uniref:Nudix hydrolase domain-containing protein n=1 Tax=Mortierella isabellina TaxID=91625 RepID=A0A8H7PHJ7_MORIS|nr:hypothetical protein INT43_005235 [Umbelopsis isabellina]